MSFKEFSYPEVIQTLGLSLLEADLFGDVAPLELPGEFLARVRAGVVLALAIDTEKARSEFIIAPLLMELHSQLKGSFGLFSGVSLNVDETRGLNGVCDFLLTRVPLQSVMTAPVVAIVEAKNDRVRTGLGQCIAAMAAAQEFNVKAGQPCRVHGVVTTGSSWKFLHIIGSEVTLDRQEYFVSDPGRIMGILAEQLKRG